MAPRFTYPADFDACWNPAAPEFACVANSISLLMPHVEPLFVRSATAALDRLEEPLQSRARSFAAEEAAHHTEHRRFNQLLAARYGLRRLESAMAAVYGWLWRSRSEAFLLAFSAGSETLAYSIARWTHAHETDVLGGADPDARRLFLWHLGEEVGHKSVAFDVHRTITGSRRYYARAMCLSLAILAVFVVAGTFTQLWHDRRWWSPVAWFRLTRWALSFFMELVPNMVVSALPGHHPSDFADPVLAHAWADAVPR